VQENGGGRMVEQSHNRLMEDLVKNARVQINRRNCRRILTR
jgi:hypothetical protein